MVKTKLIVAYLFYLAGLNGGDKCLAPDRAHMGRLSRVEPAYACMESATDCRALTESDVLREGEQFFLRGSFVSPVPVASIDGHPRGVVEPEADPRFIAVGKDEPFLATPFAYRFDPMPSDGHFVLVGDSALRIQTHHPSDTD